MLLTAEPSLQPLVFIFNYVFVLGTWICEHKYTALGIQKRVSYHLELELQVVVNMLQHLNLHFYHFFFFLALLVSVDAYSVGVDTSATMHRWTSKTNFVEFVLLPPLRGPWELNSGLKVCVAKTFTHRATL